MNNLVHFMRNLKNSSHHRYTPLINLIELIHDFEKDSDEFKLPMNSLKSCMKSSRLWVKLLMSAMTSTELWVISIESPMNFAQIVRFL